MRSSIALNLRDFQFEFLRRSKIYSANKDVEIDMNNLNVVHEIL